MSHSDQMLEMFPDTVTVRLEGQPDEYGNTTLVSEEDLKCRIDGKIRVILDKAGDAQTSNVRLTIPGYHALTVDHEYILPIRYIPRNPKALAVSQGVDETGPDASGVVIPDHERVYFYWTQTG